MKQWIENNCFTKSGLNNYCTKDYWWENRGFQEQKKEILSLTNNLIDVSMTERLYHVYHNLTEIPKCPVCNNNCNFKNFKSGYYRICSKQCVTKDKGRNIKLSDKLKGHKPTHNGEYFKTEEFKIKARKTKLEKYGNEYYTNSERLKKDYLIDCVYVAQQHFELKRSYVEIAKEIGVSEPFLSEIMMKNGYRGIRHNMQSSYEREIKHFLELHDIKVNISDRRTIKNVEMDLFLPDHNIAIEINGVYWHCEGNKKNPQHLLEKYNKLKENNIRVINIWDDEIVNKSSIVYSILSNIIKHNITVPARKCIVKEISSKEYTNFLDNNHIQGSINSSIRLGLFHEDELLSVMGFGKSRFKQEEMELHRFSNLIHVNVVGGANKLFKYFIRNYSFDTLVSYCDKRWFDGKIYEIMGFEYSHDSKPNYWYFKKGSCKLQSRMKYQKHKLSKLLKNFDTNLTEYENMKNNGYDRVFDCGNKVYIYNNKEENNGN